MITTNLQFQLHISCFVVTVAFRNWNFVAYKSWPYLQGLEMYKQPWLKSHSDLPRYAKLLCSFIWVLWVVSALFNDDVNCQNHTGSVLHEWMSMGYRWNDSDRRRQMYLEKNPPQCHTVLHKFYMDWPGGSYLVLCNERLVTKQLATVWTCIMYDSILLSMVKFYQYHYSSFWSTIVWMFVYHSPLQHLLKVLY